MAYADRFTGRDATFVFTPAGGGGPFTLSGDFTNFSMDYKQDVVDVTAGNEQDRRFLTTLRSLDWTLSVYNGDETILANVKVGSVGQLDVYPKGNASGRPIRSFDVIVTSYQESYPFDNVSEVEIGGVRNGPMASDIGATVP